MSVPANGTTTPAAPEVRLLYPTGGPAVSDQQTGTPSSPPVSDDVSRQEPPVDYFRNAFLRTRGIEIPGEQSGETTPAGDKQETDGTGAVSPDGVPSSAAGVSSPGSTVSSPGNTDRDGNVITLTQTELDRRVQAETDRLLAKRNREERARRDKEEKDRLLDTNPYEYAQRVKQEREEQAGLEAELKSATELTASTIRAYDASVLDTIFTKLPAPDMQSILEAQPIVSIPDRSKAVDMALTSLQKHWRAEGVASAREALLQDQSFVKEVLARYSGQSMEPEHIPAEGASSQAVSPEAAMNDWIRSSANQVRQRQGR